MSASVRKGQKKKTHFVTSCVLALRWISEHLLLKKNKIKHGFSLPYGKNSKTQIYIHPAKNKK